MQAVLFAFMFAILMTKLSPLAGTGGLAAVNSTLSDTSLRPECTVLNRTNLVSCQPSFIIAGTQKSGTTVLAALLSNHPMIRFSRRKETHFFDKKSSQGVASYLKLFPPWDSTSRALDEVPLFGEATPSYIASRNTCRRIAAVLPNAKLIILVREPVARAYSEYQMKSRRVAQQADFITIVTSNKKLIIRCMAKYPSNYEAIAKCIPANVSQHSRWHKLVTAWKKSAKQVQSWTQIIEGCFPHFQSALSRSLFGKKRRNISNRKNSARTALSSEVHYNTSQTATFDPISCWRHYKQGLETIKPLQKAMIDEINDFQACRLANSTDLLGENASIHVRLDHLDNIVDRCLRVRGGISSQYFYRSMYAVQLHHCFQYIPRERFLVIPSGLLRTDTAAVYAQVLSFLGLEGTLLQQTVGLRNETEVDMAGNILVTPTYTTAANDTAAVSVHLEPEQLTRAAVDKHFPNFARSTGWSLHSEYSPIPQSIQQHMQAFFVEQNELLFELLQQNFTSTW